MSTRATYQLTDTRYGNDTKQITFYIHHDGYRDGAAHYFYKAIASYNYKHFAYNDYEGEKVFHQGSGGYIEAFIRGVINAEITDSHKSHGDTEYRYDWDTKKGTLTVYERTDYANDEWASETYDIIDFVNKYHDEQVIRVEGKFNRAGIYTEECLKNLIKEEKALKKIWEKNGYQNGANYKSLIERIKVYNGYYKQIKDANKLSIATVALSA